MTNSDKARARRRIGAVSYLNTKPLVYDLAQRLPDWDIVFDLPSRLAEQLFRGDLDVALIPSVEYLQTPGYRVISDACIGCRGAVLSVKLLCRKPIKQIRTLALDEGSRTSAALVRILLDNGFGVTPEVEMLPIDNDYRGLRSDAVLLIGDRAIHASCDQFPFEFDLGELWMEWAKLPFVFAMWVAKDDGSDMGSVAQALASSRDAGLANLAAIAAEQCARVGLSESSCLRYLQDNLHFSLGDEEQQGLSLFAQQVASLDSQMAPR